MSLYAKYLEALLHGDRATCVKIIKGLLADNIELEELYVNWLQRAMYEVGDLWERNLISVATEHLATAITESLLHLTYPRLFSRPHLNKHAIIACVPNEHHQIGAHMVADIFELYGWHAYPLGANTPEKDLILSVKQRAPNVVGFSMSLLFNLPHLQHLLDVLQTNAPDVPIIVGGRAFACEAGQAELKNLQAQYRIAYLASLADLKAYIHAQ